MVRAKPDAALREDELRVLFQEMFDFNPPELSFGDPSLGASYSTSTKAPQRYDMHLRDDLILKDIVLVHNMHTHFASLAKERFEGLLAGGAYKHAQGEFVRAIDREEKITGAGGTVMHTEEDVTKFFQGYTCKMCMPVVSNLAFHPQRLGADNELLQVTDASIRSRAVVDGSLEWHKQLRVTHPRAPSGPGRITGLRDKFLQYVKPHPPLLDFMGSINTFASCEMKHLSVGDHHTMFAVLLRAAKARECGDYIIAPFRWTKCHGHDCANHEPTDNSIEGWGGYDVDDDNVMSDFIEPLLRRQGYYEAVRNPPYDGSGVSTSESGPAHGKFRVCTSRGSTSNVPPELKQDGSSTNSSTLDDKFAAEAPTQPGRTWGDFVFRKDSTTTKAMAALAKKGIAMPPTDTADILIDASLLRSGSNILDIREMEYKLRTQYGRRYQGFSRYLGYYNDDHANEVGHHLIQQAWAQSVRNNTTFFVLHSGNYEFLCIRHRGSQTLYISDILHPQSLRDPGYGQVFIGSCLWALNDAANRMRKVRELRDGHTAPVRVLAGGGLSDDGRSGQSDPLEGLSHVTGITPARNSSHQETSTSSSRKSQRSGASLLAPTAPVNAKATAKNLQSGITKKCTQSHSAAQATRKTHELGEVQRSRPCVAPLARKRLMTSGINPGPAELTLLKREVRAPNVLIVDLFDDEKTRHTSFGAFVRGIAHANGEVSYTEHAATPTDASDRLVIALWSQIVMGSAHCVRGGAIHLVHRSQTYSIPIIAKLTSKRSRIKSLEHEYYAYRYLRMKSAQSVPFCWGIFQGVDNGYTCLILSAATGVDVHIGGTDTGKTERLDRTRCLSALAELHKLDVKHGYIRPDNILVGKDGTHSLISLKKSRLGVSEAELNIEREDLLRMLDGA